MLLDILDTLANTGKTMLRFNSDFKSVVAGIEDSGVNFLLRVCVRGFTDALQQASTVHLKTVAILFREFADTLDRVVAHETDNQTE